jgi:hypothetical protein
MKKLCAIVLLLGAGCSSPGTTEINRPSPDVNGTRQLLLTTSFNETQNATIASASYSDSSTSGFGPGILITCNSVAIINTQNGIPEHDTSIRIANSRSFDWVYKGPDTNFEVFTGSAFPFLITSPESDTTIENFQSSDSLSIQYETLQGTSNLQVLLFTDPGDTMRLETKFDSETGIIAPIPLAPLVSLVEGDIGLEIQEVNPLAFSSSWTHSILIVDSSTSQQIQLLLR